MPPGTLAMLRTLPDQSHSAQVVRAAGARCRKPDLVARWATTTIPSIDTHPDDSFFSWPCVIDHSDRPSSSPPVFSWSANAISLPSGEIFGLLIQLMLSNKTLPTGYSSRQ